MAMSTTRRRYEPRPATRVARLRKVLVVDPDPYWGPALRLALEEAGYYPNQVGDAVQGACRAVERAYDLVVVSASIGEAPLQAFLAGLAKRNPLPKVLVIAGPEELSFQKDFHGVPCLSLLRRPCVADEVVDAARILVGLPWSDHRAGA
jgi:DNA-binding NtrC family response regulator